MENANEKIVLNKIVDLRKEISEWKRVLQELRSKTKKMKSNNSCKTLTRMDCKNNLSEDDLRFLNKDLKYEELASHMNTLAEEIVIQKTKIEILDARMKANLLFSGREIFRTKKMLNEILYNCNECDFMSNFKTTEDESDEDIL